MGLKVRLLGTVSLFSGLIMATCAFGGLWTNPIENPSFEANDTSSANYISQIDFWYEENDSGDWRCWTERGAQAGVPVADDGVNWGCVGDTAGVYQQIGTWDGAMNYRVTMMLGKRENNDFNGIKVMLWAGGDPSAAGDNVSLGDGGVGAVMLGESEVFYTDNPEATFSETKMVNIDVSTPETFSGLSHGAPLWINIDSATWGRYNFIDNITMKESATASNPAPADEAEYIDTTEILAWTAPEVSGTTSYSLCYGTDPALQLNTTSVTGITGTSFDPELEYGQTYYWRVDSVIDGKTYEGYVWSFSTGGKAREPQPANGAFSISPGQIDLSWTGDDYVTSYRLYAGISHPLLFAGETNSTSYQGYEAVLKSSTYYWRVDSYKNGDFIATGDEWYFNTIESSGACPEGDMDNDCRVDLSDVYIFAAQWLGTAGSAADFRSNDGVNFEDFSVLANNWMEERDGSIVINEFLASNNNGLTDEDGDSSDWIELFNTTTESVSLDGWYLTDDETNPAKWKLPNVTLGAGEFLVVFASNKNRDDVEGELHTNFILSSSGEYLALIKPDGTVAHTYGTYPAQFTDISYGLSGISTVTEEQTWIATDAPAKALVPEDNSIGYSWTGGDEPFDDSGWISGTCAVGYDTSTGGTDYTPFLGLDVSAMKGSILSSYIRIAFELENIPAVSQLMFQMRCDDGFVAFLNGHQVAAFNNIEPLEWNSGSITYYSDDSNLDFRPFDISDQKGYLKAGTNILAIQALNSSLNSSDMIQGPQLTATIVTTTPLPDASQGYFVTTTPATTNSGVQTNLGPAIKDLPQNMVSPSSYEDINLTASVSPTLASVESVKLYYQVMYKDIRSLDMLDDGLHNDGLAGDGVYGATIPANDYSSGQMVRWYVVAEDVSGNSTREPAFLSAYDSPEFYGTVVQSSASTNLPHLQWFTENVSASETDLGTRCSVFFQNRFYDNIKIHIRGGSTASAPKKHFKFNFNTGHKFYFDENEKPVDEFNLNSTYSDKAYVRQPISFMVYDACGNPGSVSFPVRAERNNIFFGVSIFIEEPEEELLEREGLDPDGVLYKVYNTFYAGGSVEQKSRDWDRNRTYFDDFCNNINGLSGTELHNYIIDHVDMPRMLGYLVATVLVHQNDHPHKNHYLYCDLDGTGEWFFMPWDHDLTLGSNWDGYSYTDTIYANDDQISGKTTSVKPSHPFIGKEDCREWNNQWNHLTNTLLNNATFREMFKRRLRTVMDDLLGAPGSSYSEKVINNWVDDMVTQIGSDATLDYNKWANPWTWGGQEGYDRDQTISEAIAILKNDYLNVRRTHLFVTHNVNNVASYNISGSYSAELPDAQPANSQINFGSYDYNPASGNQDEEYIELLNPNGYAVDISGWEISGGVEHTFRAGTIIPAGSSMFVSPNVPVFRARLTSPKGNEGKLVQGKYNGHLSSWGETLTLTDNTGRLVDTLSYAGNPSDQQRYLRISEIMYHPAGDATYNEEEFEYVELTNIGTSTVNLNGLKFTNGVLYSFDTNTNLAAGEHLVIVKNRTAFESRYGSSVNIAAGVYTGSLSNSGDTIKLEDNTNSTVLEFRYNDTWYDVTDGFGYSLCIRDTSAALEMWDSKDGWRASETVNGSPGAAEVFATPAPGTIVVNEVLAHSDTADDWIELHNTGSSPVNIGGWFLSDNLDDLMKYQIAEGTVIAANGYVVFYQDQHFGTLSTDPGKRTAFALSENGETVYLRSAVNGQLTNYWEQEDFGASDKDTSFGRFEKSTATFNFVAMSSMTPGYANSYPLVGPVVISEIMYHPEFNADAEYIELYNISGSSATLFDNETSLPWRLFDEGGFVFEFSTSPTITMSAGEKILLVKDLTAFNSEFTATPGTRIFTWGDGGLSNGGEKIELAKPGDVDLQGTRYYIRVDRVSYDDALPWPTEPDGNGKSLNRKSATTVGSNYGNDPANWEAATPTPGS